MYLLNYIVKSNVFPVREEDMLDFLLPWSPIFFSPWDVQLISEQSSQDHHQTSQILEHSIRHGSLQLLNSIPKPGNFSLHVWSFKKYKNPVIMLIICITAVMNQHLMGLSIPHLPGKNICGSVDHSDAMAAYSKVLPTHGKNNRK